MNITENIQKAKQLLEEADAILSLREQGWV
jgi:hypothetical protein